MNGKRIILAVIVLAFVVLASIAIFSIDWGGSRDPVLDAVKPVNISDYANTDVKVRMSVRGDINANQEHQDMQITVGRQATVGELLGGYQGSVTRTEQTSNNTESYKAFLSALHNAGFTRIQLPQKGLQYDGACPKGTRYTFEFLGGQDTPASTWATTCGKKQGSFAGDLPLVKSLFNLQLPDAQLDALTKDSQF